MNTPNDSEVIARVSETEREIALRDSAGAVRCALVDDDTGWAELLTPTKGGAA